MPLVEQYERAREAQIVQQIQDNQGPGGTAVTGSDDVIAALLTGQVMTLVLNDDFTSPGWADFEQSLVGAGDVPAEHPYGGDAAALVAVQLEQELIRLALQQDATLEIVATEVPISAEELDHVPEAGQARPRAEAATQLDALGGIGAILRFALSGDQATADL
jgi:peptide subunit release factor 1 (eRF1)